MLRLLGKLIEFIHLHIHELPSALLAKFDIYYI